MDAITQCPTCGAYTCRCQRCGRVWHPEEPPGTCPQCRQREWRTKPLTRKKVLELARAGIGKKDKTG